MKKISSDSTFFLKRVFPIVWYGVLGIFAVIILLGIVTSGEVEFELLLIPSIIAVLGYVVMKFLVFDLADEVWDDTDSLFVKCNGIEERIPLSNIKDVSYLAAKPPRITLSLREPGQLGADITFSPPGDYNRWKESPIVGELRQRIDAMKR